MSTKIQTFLIFVVILLPLIVFVASAIAAAIRGLNMPNDDGERM